MGKVEACLDDEGLLGGFSSIGLTDNKVATSVLDLDPNTIAAKLGDIAGGREADEEKEA